MWWKLIKDLKLKFCFGQTLVAVPGFSKNQHAVPTADDEVPLSGGTDHDNLID